MAVSLDLIKQLRSDTQASLMDVRNALEESDSDITKAKEWLRKRGLDKASKKSDRETSEGWIGNYVHAGKIAALVKLSCETDFVAKTDEFQVLSREIAMQVASMNPENIEELLKQSYIRDTKKTIDDLVKELIAKMGENIQVTEMCRMAI